MAIPDRLNVRDASLKLADGPLVGAFPSLDVPDRTPYWNRGIERVPQITGAESVMDCRDLAQACAQLGVLLPLKGRVIDIGCGTARWQPYCEAYIGLDISPSAVAYANRRGIVAHQIQGYGPDALDGWLVWSDWVCCFSVFTHIPFEERHDYLDAFKRIAPDVLVDIIPGEEGGDVILWRADPERFTQDARDIGWEIVKTADRTSPDNVTHRYYHLRRR